MWLSVVSLSLCRVWLDMPRVGSLLVSDLERLSGRGRELRRSPCRA
jgi:hypothetical protein